MTDHSPIDSAADHMIDDAPRHLAAKGFLPELSCEAAHTHMGLYLGWAMARGMMSQTFQNEHAGDLAAFKDKQLTGPQLAGRLGGVLHLSLFNDELARFSRRYYSKAGRFFPDYIHTFMKPIVQARSMYVLADTCVDGVNAILSIHTQDIAAMGGSHCVAARRPYATGQKISVDRRYRRCNCFRQIKCRRTRSRGVAEKTPSGIFHVYAISAHQYVPFAD